MRLKITLLKLKSEPKLCKKNVNFDIFLQPFELFQVFNSKNVRDSGSKPEKNTAWQKLVLYRLYKPSNHDMPLRNLFLPKKHF